MDYLSKFRDSMKHPQEMTTSSPSTLPQSKPFASYLRCLPPLLSLLSTICSPATQSSSAYGLLVAPPSSSTDLFGVMATHTHLGSFVSLPLLTRMSASSRLHSIISTEELKKKHLNLLPSGTFYFSSRLNFVSHL